MQTKTPAIHLRNTDGEIVICAWCWPIATFLKHYPNYEGRKISHGICQTCSELELAKIIKAKLPK